MKHDSECEMYSEACGCESRKQKDAEIAALKEKCNALENSLVQHDAILEAKGRRPLMPNPEIPIAFTETFPLLVCPECKAEFVLIYWYGEAGWGKQVSTYYCPYCGKKWKEAKDA